MRNRLKGSMIGVAAVAVLIVASLFVTRSSGQAQRPARLDGHPNFSGIWQALNEANWDLEAHAARPGAVTQPGVYPFDYARVPAAPVVALGVDALPDYVAPYEDTRSELALRFPENGRGLCAGRALVVAGPTHTRQRIALGFERQAPDGALDV